MSMPDRIRFQDPDTERWITKRVIGCRVLQDWVWWRTDDGRLIRDDLCISDPGISDVLEEFTDTAGRVAESITGLSKAVGEASAAVGGWIRDDGTIELDHISLNRRREP